MDCFRGRVGVIIQTLARAPINGFIGPADVYDLRGCDIRDPEDAVDVLCELSEPLLTISERQLDALSLGDVLQDPEAADDCSVLVAERYAGVGDGLDFTAFRRALI